MVRDRTLAGKREATAKAERRTNLHHAIQRRDHDRRARGPRARAHLYYPARRGASWPRAGWRTGWASGASSVLTWAAPPRTFACSTAPARTTHETTLAGLPVAVPVLDVHTVGAGGGSAGASGCGRRIARGAGKRGRRARTYLLRTRRLAASRDRRPSAARGGWARIAFWEASFRSTRRRRRRVLRNSCAAGREPERVGEPAG